MRCDFLFNAHLNVLKCKITHTGSIGPLSRGRGLG
ncbi:hypothetical protein NB714_001877 [Pantoea dispersa]|nr:hypothetical protein [Pantoea dispersa]MCW0325752.1 hypothetical protein [Pantoea dispersa]MCW0430519.1 hypothetical protein [Pantoea dispersa]